MAWSGGWSPFTAVILVVVACSAIPLSSNFLNFLKYEHQRCLGNICPKWLFCDSVGRTCEPCSVCSDVELALDECEAPARCSNKAIGSYHLYCPELCVKIGIACQVPICRPKKTAFGVYLGTICEISCNNQVKENITCISDGGRASVRWDKKHEFLEECYPRTTPLSNVSTTAHDPDMGNVSQPHIPWISGVASGVGIVLISVVVASFIIICRRKRNMCKETPNPSNPLPPHGKEATEKEPKIPTETEDPPNTHPEAVEDECMPVNGAQEDHSAPHTGTHREAVENEYVPSADTSGIGSAEPCEHQLDDSTNEQFSLIQDHRNQPPTNWSQTNNSSVRRYPIEYQSDGSVHLLHQTDLRTHNQTGHQILPYGVETHPKTIEH